MSSQNIADAPTLRAEAARHRITIKEIAEGLGLSQDYISMIFSGKRDAPRRRAEIEKYIKGREAS